MTRDVGNLQIPGTIVDRYQPLNRTNYERIRKEELIPHLDLHGLKFLRDKAGHERNMRELYRGRALYELLQNADDAGAKKAIFVLARDGLAFAHDGQWFTVSNFRSLADGWSDKDPNECIGHKGLGFRSVLDISPSPSLLKVDAKEYLAIKFTWALNNGHIQSTFQRDPSLRSHYQDWTKHGQRACPVMAIPGLATKDSLGSGAAILDRLLRNEYGTGFTTMFWLPATDPDIQPGVLSELDLMTITSGASGRQKLLTFVNGEVATILPFLASITTVAAYEDAQRFAAACVLGIPDKTGRGEITVRRESAGKIEDQSFFLWRSEHPIPTHIRSSPDTPKAVKSLKSARAVLCVRLQGGQPMHDGQACFHVYFPTRDATDMGFIVHGDFFVMPDRTRLMEKNSYNSWLFTRIAEIAAGPFLTTLLQTYEARSVFEALAPTQVGLIRSEHEFLDHFASALRSRVEPLVPTSIGLVGRDQAVLPPEIDAAGFWEGHFGDVVGSAVPGKTAFLAHELDAKGVRNFLKLAGIRVLDDESLVRLIETPTTGLRGAGWWYECYRYLASDSKLARRSVDFFVGRKLLPTGNGDVIAIPEENTLIVCLPPAGTASSLRVPNSFAMAFVFLQQDLAGLLLEGDDHTRRWVAEYFGVSRFEATDLLPRAVRRVAPQLFSADNPVASAELVELWMFIRQIVDSSRVAITDPKFWQEIGRLPVILNGKATGDGMLTASALAPAFLTYWPDSCLEWDNWLVLIPGLRRVDENFLNELFAQEQTRDRWLDFFTQAGVSAVPKLLAFRREIAKGEEVAFVANALDQIGSGQFTGDRQHDENLAVVEVLQAEGQWSNIVRETGLCNHTAPRVLRTITVLDALGPCTLVAGREYDSDDERWQKRLSSLAQSLPDAAAQSTGNDAALCLHGREGHSLSMSSYLHRQLKLHAWVASTRGPTTSDQCFARLTTRRLISSGRSEDELGDALLPYVVVSSLEDLARLDRLLVRELDDAASSSPSTLMSALRILGRQLSSEWGQGEFCKVPGRWRLVHGAIQEVYRVLNQASFTSESLPGIEFAARTSDGVVFRSPPLYYAEPGSAIEQAFLQALPLFDADRAYRQLFERAGITRLTPGETIEEQLLLQNQAISSALLEEQIAAELAPYLLASIIAKSERVTQAEAQVRRLQARFSVKTLDELRVSFSLKTDPSLTFEVKFPRFYLQRIVLPGSGAIQEAHYTLFVAGHSRSSLFDLDGDALGAALIGVFFDGPADDSAGLLPRVAARYCQVKGDRSAMTEFLYRQLSVSQEALDVAFALISGETVVEPPQPPPSRVITSPYSDSPGQPSIGQKHEEQMKKQISDLVEEFGQSNPKRPHTPHSGRGERTVGITPAQEELGRRGEEEIKRRLELPGGWDDLSLLKDTRWDGCGYDFLCALGGREVKVEVKTFSERGQVVVTREELQEAARSRADYYLLGVQADDKLSSGWRTYRVPDPINSLLGKGNFEIQPKLHVPAADIFNLARETHR